MNNSSYYIGVSFVVGYLLAYIMYKINLKDWKGEFTSLQKQIDQFKSIHDSDLN